MTLIVFHGETNSPCILFGEAGFNVPIQKVGSQTVLILADPMGASMDMMDLS